MIHRRSSTQFNRSQSGVLFIPKGTYVISKRIDITKGNVILRGAGAGQTILLFPKSLEDLFGNKPNNDQSQWAFRPGLINVTGKDPINAATRLATVTAPAKRGDAPWQLSNPVSVKRGEWIRLLRGDPPKDSPETGSLIRYLYGDLMPPGEGAHRRAGVWCDFCLA